MNRVIGVPLMVLALYGVLLVSDENAHSLVNHQNIAKRAGLFGVLTLGVGLLIISGGIDLSIGSVVGLSAVTLALLLERRFSPWLASLAVLGIVIPIGLFHGLLVTKLRLPAFIVTLCGLFIYRGLAQWATRTPQGSSRDVGIGGRPDLEAFRYWAVGDLGGIPVILLLLLGLAALAVIFLHFSVYGRYLYAVGYNEQAARYAGISTDRYKILAYVISSVMAGLGGALLLLDLQTAQPSNAGLMYELYAITGAVLGGCSLRGGQGTIVGILLGTAILPLLRNLCIFADIPSDLEYTVIGAALLFGTVGDELLKRRNSNRI